MTTGELTQVILMALLVVVTSIYAWRTFAISSATRKQADASVKMVEEMREQRLSEARPYLLIRLADEFVQWDNTEQGKRPTKFQVTIRNVGKGPAKNLWAAMWGTMKVYFGDRKGYLAPDEEWKTDISRLNTGGVEMGIYKKGWLPELTEIIKQDDPGTVAVKYQDIHEHAWATYLILERHVDVEAYVIEGEQSIVEVNQSD